MLQICIRFAVALVVSAVLSAYSPAAEPTSKNDDVVRVDIDSAGKIHIFDSAGHETMPPPDKDQVSCSSAKIAEDKHTVGWLGEYPNDSNSYPLPLALVIYRGGKVIHEFGPGQSIWDWQFLKAGAEVAFWIGPTHGDFVPHFELHDVRSGKVLAQWDGHIDQKHPAWVDGLKE
ncbi:MAG TPA: hypothetical protein VEI49_05395 [Terriglobales bacterium]|nr:hypothetical protein [Terriglobales bacterium]